MNSRSLYLRLLRYVKPYWRVFSLAIFAMIIMALTEPALPALLKPLLDGAFVEKDSTLMQWIPILLMLVIFLKGIAMFVSSVSMTWIASRLVMDLRAEMFDKILTLPTKEFDNTSSGVLLSKVTYDVSRVMAASTDALVIIVRDSLAVLGLLIWMFYLNWLLSSIIFTIVPVIIIIIRLVSKRLRRINTSLQDTMGNMTRILEEAISGHKFIKIFGGQQYENNRFQASANKVRQFEVKTQVTSGFSIFIVQMLTALALSTIIYIASILSASENITVGGFVSLFTAMGMLFAPIKRLTKVNDQLQQGLAAAQSIFNLIDQQSEKDNGKHKIAQLNGDIHFQQLTFNYDQAENNAINNINLSISAGETVALVGASGSGKTTLVNLLPHFYPMETGTILLDNHDIKDLPLATLRQNMALVSQEIVLFNDTVAANIAYGEMANAKREDIITAAKSAYAMEFIEQMPQGLDTIIGERGVKLSGGQRQRIAIARALLKNAPILIFDEATSALDTQSEKKVQQSLETLKQGRTTIIIAHRLSTIAKADRIVVMEKGKIVEVGQHEILLAKQGVYAALYRVQQETN